MVRGTPMGSCHSFVMTHFLNGPFEFGVVDKVVITSNASEFCGKFWFQRVHYLGRNFKLLYHCVVELS
jgi:hypothetical protein